MNIINNVVLEELASAMNGLHGDSRNIGHILYTITTYMEQVKKIKIVWRVAK